MLGRVGLVERAGAAGVLSEVGFLEELQAWLGGWDNLVAAYALVAWAGYVRSCGKCCMSS